MQPERGGERERKGGEREVGEGKSERDGRGGSERKGRDIWEVREIGERGRGEREG